LAARRAAGRRFELLDATFDLIQALVGPLRGLVGGFGALGRALHLRVELIQAGVDVRELVFVGGAGAKARGGDDRDAKHACRLQMLFGQKHSTPPSSGSLEYSGLFAEAMTPPSADV